MGNLHITTVQTNLHWENKQANLLMLEEKISRAGKTEIIILPEMFNTGFTMNAGKFAEPMEGDSVAWMHNMASKYRVIITGSLIIEEGGLYYNRLVWMLPNGHFGFYNKRHLFAYAGEDREFKPGNSRLIASVNGWKINLLVCYDLRFPVWSRQQVKKEGEKMEPEYDVLVYVANWPDKRSHAWRTLLTARAIENQCWVIGVNRVGKDGNDILYSGDSMVIDPLGEIVYQCKNEEAVNTISLSRENLQAVRDRFPFWKDADNFQL